MLIDAALRPRRQRRAARQLQTTGAVPTATPSPARTPAVWVAGALGLIALRVGEWALTGIAHAGADAHRLDRPIGGYLVSVGALSVAMAAVFITVVRAIVATTRPPIRYRTHWTDVSHLAVGDLIEIDEPPTQHRHRTDRTGSRIVRIQEIIPWTHGPYLVLSDHTTIATQPDQHVAVADIHPADRWNLHL